MIATKIHNSFMSLSLQVVIPSFNRNQMLRFLLGRINEEALGFNVSVRVFDDGSKEPVIESASNYPNLVNLSMVRYNNHGKKQYWQLVNHIFNYLSKTKHDLFIYLPDDIDIAQDFFKRALTQWYAIKDDKKLTLNLALDSRTQCWTKFERYKVKFGSTEVFKSQWFDMAMLFDRKLLRYRVKSINPKIWEEKPLLSSGVGAQLSKRFHKAGYSMYQVTESLIYHGDHPSMMNPEERNQNPLVIDRHQFKGDSIIKFSPQTKPKDLICTASLASIPDRAFSLEKVIESLYFQVDKLNVFLNNYDKIPDFLTGDSKINVSTSKIHGDLGDSGKFWWCDQVEGYHFICDDDLTYPPDYVSFLIRKIEQYERKAIVGLHGSSFRQPFRHYHPPDPSRVAFSCTKSLEEDTLVQILGTGVLAYHTSTLKLSHSDFEYKNMADIWFNLVAQKYQVPRICVQRVENWIKHNEIDLNKTIFCQSNPDTEIYNLSTRNVQDYVIKNTQPWHINYLKDKPIVVLSLIIKDNDIERIKSCIDSWNQTKSKKYYWILLIVVKMNLDNKVFDYLHNDLPASHIQCRKNPSIIRPHWQFTVLFCKVNNTAVYINSILKYCKNIEFDYGFYIDNNVKFTKLGWDNLYIEAIKKSGYSNLYYQNRSYKSFELDHSGYCSGSKNSSEFDQLVLFTFTKKQMDQVGYADVQKNLSENECLLDIFNRYSRAGLNDSKFWWDAKGSNEYISLEFDLSIETNQSEISLSTNKKYNLIINDEKRVSVDRDTANSPIFQENSLDRYFDCIYVLTEDVSSFYRKQLSSWASQNNISLRCFPSIKVDEPKYKSHWENYVQKGVVHLPEHIPPVQNIREFFFDYDYDVARVAYIENKIGKKALPTPEAWSHLLSIIHLLEDAISNDFKRILILEDDVVPHQSINSLFSQGVQQLPDDWKIVFLGSSPNLLESYVIPYSQNLYQPNGTAYGSFAVAIQCSAFVPLLHYAKKFDLPFDLGALHKVQRKYSQQCLTFQPNLFIKNTNTFKQLGFILDYEVDSVTENDFFDIVQSYIQRQEYNLLIQKCSSILTTHPLAKYVFPLLEEAYTNKKSDQEKSNFYNIVQDMRQLLVAPDIEKIWGQVIWEPSRNIPPLAQNKNTRNKIVIYTCVWKRPELTKIVLSYYDQLKQDLSDRIDIQLIAVGSEGDRSRWLCESCGFNYIEYQNKPLSDKWEYGINRCRDYDPDAVIIVGSDDLISRSLIEFYDKQLKEGLVFGGILDAYILDLESEQMIYWPGYNIKVDVVNNINRLGETAGVGRCLSRALLEKLDFSIWSRLNKDRGLDGAMTQKLYQYGLELLDYKHSILTQVGDRVLKIGHCGFKLADINAFAVDIKFSENITTFKRYGIRSSIITQSNPWEVLARYFPNSTIEQLKNIVV